MRDLYSTCRIQTMAEQKFPAVGGLRRASLRSAAGCDLDYPDYWFYHHPCYSVEKLPDILPLTIILHKTQLEVLNDRTSSGDVTVVGVNGQVLDIDFCSPFESQCDFVECVHRACEAHYGEAPCMKVLVGDKVLYPTQDWQGVWSIDGPIVFTVLVSSNCVCTNTSDYVAINYSEYYCDFCNRSV